MKIEYKVQWNADRNKKDKMHAYAYTPIYKMPDERENILRIYADPFVFRCSSPRAVPSGTSTYQTPNLLKQFCFFLCATLFI